MKVDTRSTIIGLEREQIDGFFEKVKEPLMDIVPNDLKERPKYALENGKIVNADIQFFNREVYCVISINLLIKKEQE